MTQLTVLGGGVAGLAAAYFAGRDGLAATVYEAGDEVGGNCRTLRHGDFRFDTGAHRFHDQDPEITDEVRALLGDDLRGVDAPSQIFHQGRYIDFPLSPLDVARKLGVRTTLKAGLAFAQERLRAPRADGSFESLALKRYGKTIAEAFLLNYSVKLWGLPCDRLSPQIAGQRLKGLTLGTFLREAVFAGGKRKTRHLDGAFYYPRRGIGMLTDRLAAAVGPERIHTGARAVRFHHDGAQIRAVTIAGQGEVPTEEVISSVDLRVLVEGLRPAAPEPVLAAARALRYRCVVVVALFLQRERLSANASVYFPAGDLPFTRAYEPKNRSLEMAPPGQTCVALEIPCQREDVPWGAPASELIANIAATCERIGWFRQDEVLGGSVAKLPDAYPILHLGAEDTVVLLVEYLSRFRNLKLIGRNGRFEYSHIHDQLRLGKETVLACRDPEAASR